MTERRVRKTGVHLSSAIRLISSVKNMMSEAILFSRSCIILAEATNFILRRLRRETKLRISVEATHTLITCLIASIASASASPESCAT